MIVESTFSRADCQQVADIYNHYVRESTATFDTDPVDSQFIYNKFTALTDTGHPVLLAKQDEHVVGYAYTAPYRPKNAYRHTVENTLYLAERQRGNGIGSALFSALIEKASKAGFRQMIAVITSDATASIAIHKKFGFQYCGENLNVGVKFGKWISTSQYQRSLGEGHTSLPKNG